MQFILILWFYINHVTTSNFSRSKHWFQVGTCCGANATVIIRDGNVTAQMPRIEILIVEEIMRQDNQHL